jgi:hypothetical protein
MYDAEVRYNLPLKLSATSDGGYIVTNSGKSILHDFVLLSPSAGGWQSNTPVDVPPTVATPATQPSTRPATTGPVASATRPSTGPSVATTAPGPAAQPGTPISLTPTTRPASDALVDLKPQLAALGLGPSDVNVVLAILRRQALDDKHVIAVYRLDQPEMDRLLPLEVVPQPAKVTRAGLVVARNIDPRINSEIDSLIVQLGDDDWAKREQATKALAALGLLAKSKLETASNHKDAEIAFRAERILADLNKPAAPAAGQ